MEIQEIIRKAFEEDNVDPMNRYPAGDHSSFCCIPSGTQSKARLLVKDTGIIAGIQFSKEVIHFADPSLKMYQILKDGQQVNPGDAAFYIEGPVTSILKAERIVLNFMQRMSAIATLTNQYVKEVEGTDAKILDTRKTTPLLRSIEKMAVRIGGGHNHRFGLYDMIMLKDNHIDYCGSIEKAIDAARVYRSNLNMDIKIEIETRSLSDVEHVVKHGGVERIMFDNFSIEDTRKAVQIVNGKLETESSGGIHIGNVRAYADCGVNFISVGALTHSVPNFDLSLKASV